MCTTAASFLPSFLRSVRFCPVLSSTSVLSNSHVQLSKAHCAPPHLRSTAGPPPRPYHHPRPLTHLLGPSRHPPLQHPQPPHSGTQPPDLPPHSVLPSILSCLTTPQFHGDSRHFPKPHRLPLLLPLLQLLLHPSLWCGQRAILLHCLPHLRS